MASGSCYLAVTPRDVVIGAGGWTRAWAGSGETEDNVGHIRHVATDPDWTGKRRRPCDHGALLRGGGVRAADMLGLACYSSLNAVDFPTRLGFKETRRIDIPMGGDLVMPSVLMDLTF